MCNIVVEGGGLKPKDKVALFAEAGAGLGIPCGMPVLGVNFADGFGGNPVRQVPGSSYEKSITGKEFSFGEAQVSNAGRYRVCYCVKGLGFPEQKLREIMEEKHGFSPSTQFIQPMEDRLDARKFTMMLDFELDKFDSALNEFKNGS